MVFSKSFGYAVRSLIFLSSQQGGSRSYIQAEEISGELGIPRHFLSKVLQSLAKQGILNSSKGPSGGFTLNEKSLHTSLISLIPTTKALPNLHTCTLKAKPCDASKPCPMHKQSNTIRKEILRVLSETDISKLITEFNAGQSEPFSEFGKKNIVINSHPLTAVITP
jgi:Rrf2 family iron-sulfur cluster assembly transcriptional regulator